MPVDVHPSELAYAFAYAKAEEVIGWGSEPFRPPGEGEAAAADWLTLGENLLVAEGRLTGTPDAGLNFTDEMVAAVLALVAPGVVLLAQRRAEGGVRSMTVHLRDDDLVGLTLDTEGMFDLTRYADIAAAAAAIAAFAGTTLAPLDHEARIESDRETLTAVHRMARAGQLSDGGAVLEGLGASEADAAAAVAAMAAPAAAGVVTVLYCRNNAVEDAESFAVMTDEQDRSWILFSPASAEGPMVLERCSVAALAARIVVNLAARLGAAG